MANDETPRRLAAATRRALRNLHAVCDGARRMLARGERLAGDLARDPELTPEERMLMANLAGAARGGLYRLEQGARPLAGLTILARAQDGGGGEGEEDTVAGR